MTKNPEITDKENIMATKKPSGLGRGLGDLLSDNTPEVRKSTAKVVIRQETKKITVSNPDIYPEITRNRSVKSNFKK